MKPRRALLDRSLPTALVALVAVFLLFEFTSLDLRVQDRFYDFETGSWLVDAKAPLPRLFFYTGVKILIIATGVALLGMALGPERWRSPWKTRRRDLWVAVALLASAPALVALGKATTNTFCPYQIRRYDGQAPYVRVLEAYPPGDRPAKRGRGFPAGHASGGFALFGLAGLAHTRRGRLFAIGDAVDSRLR